MSVFLPETIINWLPDTIQLFYLVATAFFIRGVKLLNSPSTARKGNQFAATGMMIGVLVTLFDQNIVEFELIIGGIVIGGLIGLLLAKKVQMTSMPELVAIFNGFGGAASALVAWGELARNPEILSFDTAGLVSIGLSVFIGALTFTGSFIAFGKLSGFISGNAITFPGLNVINIGAMIATLGLIGYFAFDPTNSTLFWIIIL